MTELERSSFHLKVAAQLRILYDTEFSALGAEPVPVDADNPTMVESESIAAHQVRARVLKTYKTIVEQSKGAAKLAMPIYQYVYEDAKHGTGSEILEVLNKL